MAFDAWYDTPYGMAFGGLRESFSGEGTATTKLKIEKGSYDRIFCVLKC